MTRSFEKSLYRENALKNLSALDEDSAPLKIVTVRAWMWLALFSLMLLIFTLWFFLGTVTLRVKAPGILLTEGSQMIPVVYHQSGTVTEVLVKTGSEVQKGDLLARIRVPYGSESLTYLTQVNVARQRELNQLQNELTLSAKNLQDEFDQMERSSKVSLQLKQEKLKTLEILLKDMQQLYRKHYLTLPDLLKTQEQYQTTLEDCMKLKISLETLTLQYQEKRREMDKQLQDKKDIAAASAHTLDLKTLEQQEGTEIRSPVRGRVESVNIVSGESVTPNASLFTLSTWQPTKKLYAIVFMNQSDAKKVKSGSRVLLLPYNTAAYGQGYLIGFVRSLTAYPASKTSVMAYLRNEAWVDEFFQQGAPVMGMIELKMDANHPESYVWTSRQQHARLQSGTK